MQLLFTILAGLAATPPPGQCLSTASARITAGLLAQSAPAFAAVPADAVLGFAPAPGIPRIIGPRELNGWLRRHKQPASTGPNTSVCVLRAPLDDGFGTAAAAIRQAIAAASRRIEFRLEAVRGAIPEGGSAHFDLRDLPDLAGPEEAVSWPGWAHDPGGSRTGRITAQVWVAEWAARAFAARSIRQGAAYSDGDIVWRRGWGPPGFFPGAPTPGMSWTKPKKPGEAIERSDLRAPNVVTRGDPVDLEVRGGAVRLVVTARALRSGAPGERIPVSSPFAKRIVDAIVLEKGHVRAIFQSNEP